MRPLVPLPQAHTGLRGGRNRGRLGGCWGVGLAGPAKATEMLNLVGRYSGESWPLCFQAEGAGECRRRVSGPLAFVG